MYFRRLGSLNLCQTKCSHQFFAQAGKAIDENWLPACFAIEAWMRGNINPANCV